MYTNRTRITGMSGIDTETLVKQMMRAESLKLDRMQKNKTLLTWQQEGYRNIFTSLTTFQNSYLSYSANQGNNIRSAANFTGLASTIKMNNVESNAISVRSAAGAKAGTYDIKVYSMAKNDMYVSKPEKIKLDINMGDFNQIKSNLLDGDSIRVSLDGDIKELKFEAADLNGSEANFISKINTKLKTLFGTDSSGDQKVKMDTNGTNLLIQAGKGHSVSVSEGNRSGKSSTGLELPNDFEITGVRKFSVNGTEVEVDFGTSTSLSLIAPKINEALKAANVKDVQFSFDGKKFTVHNATSAPVELEDDSLLLNIGFANLDASGKMDLRSNSVLSDMGVTNSTTTVSLSSSIGDLFNLTGNAVFTINNESFNIDPTATLREVIDEVNRSAAGVKLSFDGTMGSFTLESRTMGAASKINFSGSFLTDNLGFGNTDPSYDPHKSKAADADFEINGVRTTRTTNSFTFNGLNITLNDIPVRDDGLPYEFEVKMTANVTATKDLILKFVDDYNKLVKSLNDATNIPREKANRYTYYEPLTSEEKKAMSDKEVEQWEEKAKTGVLYRDDAVRGIASQLRSMLYESVELEDGTSISLYNIGITTSSKLGEAGMLQIDDAKLTAALENNADAVSQLFTKGSDISPLDKTQRNARLKSEGLSERINDIITWNTTSSGGGALYNKIGTSASDVTSDMYKKIKEQDDKINDMLDYLARREDFYYSMFAKMEAAVNESNSQMNALLGFMGQGQS